MQMELLESVIRMDAYTCEMLNQLQCSTMSVTPITLFGKMVYWLNLWHQNIIMSPFLST